MLGDSYWTWNHKKFKIRKGDIGVIKNFLFFLRSNGFKKNKGKDYIFKEWGIGISGTNLIFYYMPPENQGINSDVIFDDGQIVNIILNAHLNKSTFNLKYYEEKDNDGNYPKDTNEFLIKTFSKMEIFIKNELKWEFRQRKINKLLNNE